MFVIDIHNLPIFEIFTHHIPLLRIVQKDRD